MRQFSIVVTAPTGEQQVFVVDAVHWGDALLACWFRAHPPCMSAEVRSHQYHPPGKEPTLFAAVASPIEGRGSE